MSTKIKFILTYIGGIATGILLFIAFIFYMAAKQSNSEDGTQLFDRPGQEINADSFQVMQVLQDGSALATPYDHEGLLDYRMIVMFQASDNTSYYDNMVISLPKGKCYRQIGTYRYENRQGMEKTVPIIDIFDK